MAPRVLATPRDLAHSHQRRNAVDSNILARTGHTVRVERDHIDNEEPRRSCFYCLEGWVFLGSIGQNDEEIVEAICCQRCSRTS
jgi:hypothetical protein